jgi:hypothetical protein
MTTKARTYAIAFDFPEGTMYAGMHKGAFGWARTLATAVVYDNEATAKRVLDNAYGEAAAKWGRVVIVDRVAPA